MPAGYPSLVLHSSLNLDSMEVLASLEINILKHLHNLNGDIRYGNNCNKTQEWNAGTTRSQNIHIWLKICADICLWDQLCARQFISTPISWGKYLVKHTRSKKNPESVVSNEHLYSFAKEWQWPWPRRPITWQCSAWERGDVYQSRDVERLISIFLYGGKHRPYH